MTLLNTLKNVCQEESGQDLVEYALLLALLALVSVATMGSLGSQINSEFTKISGQMT